MPIVLNNLRTPRIDRWAADMIWPEVANVDQEYACTLRESPTTGARVTLGTLGHNSTEHEHRNDCGDSQLRLEMT